MRELIALTATKSVPGHVRMTMYEATMVMIKVDDAIICKAFLSILDGIALDWFNTTPYG